MCITVSSYFYCLSFVVVLCSFALLCGGFASLCCVLASLSLFVVVLSLFVVFLLYVSGVLLSLVLVILCHCAVSGLCGVLKPLLWWFCISVVICDIVVLGLCGSFMFLCRCVSSLWNIASLCSFTCTCFISCLISEHEALSVIHRLEPFCGYMGLFICLSVGHVASDLRAGTVSVLSD